MIGEWIDQRLHWALGFAMGRSLRDIRHKTSEEKVALVMKFVRKREDWQHADKERGPDGFYGDGSRHDEESFREGAEAGAGLKK